LNVTLMFITTSTGWQLSSVSVNCHSRSAATAELAISGCASPSTLMSVR
jgi:hypothetical protein